MAAKILIIEDDLFLVRAYQAKLESLGYVVKIVTDGAAGLQALDDFGPDLVILDLIMPGVDGFEFLRRAKEMPKYKDLPIVVATNLGQVSDMDKVKDMGVVDYIVKSDLSLDALVDKIKKALKRHSETETEAN